MAHIPVRHPCGAAFGCPNRFSCRFVEPRGSHQSLPHHQNKKGGTRPPFLFWRRGRDSNPRTVAGQRFSRPPLSTTQPPLRNSIVNLSHRFLPVPLSCGGLKRRFPPRYSGHPCPPPFGPSRLARCSNSSRSRHPASRDISTSCTSSGRIGRPLSHLSKTQLRGTSNEVRGTRFYSALRPSSLYSRGRRIPYERPSFQRGAGLKSGGYGLISGTNQVCCSQ